MQLQILKISAVRWTHVTNIADKILAFKWANQHFYTQNDRKKMWNYSE